MSKVTDEELNGAAAALLGLHARKSRPAPPPSGSPPSRARPCPVSLPTDKDTPRSRFWHLKPGQLSPSFTSRPPSRAEPAATPKEESPSTNPYPFYPAPSVAGVAATVTSSPAYSERPSQQNQQKEQQEQQHFVGYYTSRKAPVVSTRQNFLGTAGGSGEWTAAQQSRTSPTATSPAAATKTVAAAAAPAEAPRLHQRGGEWTPRYGPSMVVVDPRASMPVVHAAPGVDPWTFHQQRREEQRPVIRIGQIPSPPANRDDACHGHEMNVEGPGAGKFSAGGRSVYLHHQQAYVDDHYQGYHRSPRPAAADPSRGRTLPEAHCRYVTSTQYEVKQQQQQEAYAYQSHSQHDDYHREKQRHGQERDHYEHQPAADDAALHPRPDQQQQPEQSQSQSQPPQKQEAEQPKKPSINNLWSLIPGTLEREACRQGGHQNTTGVNNASNNPVTGGGGGPTAYAQQPTKRERWYAPDVHRPLTDNARRHRARALARIRARRQALAEAASSSGRPTPVKRHSSDTTNEADSSSDGEDENKKDHQRHRNKVFIVDSAAGADAGGLASTVSGAVPRAIRGDSVTGGDASGNGSGSRSGSGNTPAAVAAPVKTSGANEEGASPSAMCGGNTTAAETTATTTTNASGRGSSTSTHEVTADDGSSRDSASRSGSSSKANGSLNSNPKVGDLFELMRNVTMSFGAGGEAVDGQERMARELGKPVKYRYRQEAARSRKRTRGRFVSEKAPAFVSITELMALRRAERERQKKEEATVVPVGAG